MLLHDRVSDGEPEPGALADFLGCKKRIEDLADDVSSGMPGPSSLTSSIAEPRSVIVRRADHDRSAPRRAEARLLGIDQQVQQHLLDLVAVGEHIGIPAASASMTSMFETRCS